MFKHIRNILLVFIGMVIVGYLALVCVYALPTEPIQKNVAEAANIMQMDGSHPELIYGHQDTMLDNLTDSKMLGIAQYRITKNVFEEALLGNRMSVDGLMDSELIAAEGSGEIFESSTISYGRYWHGYLVYLKPLLYVFNYGQIRYLIGFVHFSLLSLVLYLLVKKNKEEHVIPFLMAYLFLNPATLTLSLQYFPASILTMIQFVIFLCYKDAYKKNRMIWLYHFFIVGCLVSYFDFFTYPLLTLGMPLTFLLYENPKSTKENIISFVQNCVAWSIGYASMWASKWMLGTLFTEENMLVDAIGNVFLRVGVGESKEKISDLEVIIKNISANKMNLLIVLVIVIGIMAYGIKKYSQMDLKKLNVGVAMCVMLPFCWYIVVSNHSMVHYWFTYRIIAISIYAILLSFVAVFIKKEG